MPQLNGWKAMVKVALVEAAGRQKEGPILEWLSVAERVERTIEELADSGEGFENLDRKFSAALTRIILKPNGCEILLHEIAAYQTNENKCFRVIKGRQIYWMILRHYQANSNMDLVYSLKHLAKIQWMGQRETQVFGDLARSRIPPEDPYSGGESRRDAP
jgi:hypothetical protein